MSLVPAGRCAVPGPGVSVGLGANALGILSVRLLLSDQNKRIK